MKQFTHFFILLCFSSYGQKEASQWHFGANCGVNFLNNPPTAIGGGSMSAIEGCASISDAAGNLLFYTNGFLIWNKNHQLMPNSLGGHASSIQSSLILHKSGTEYYVFTTGAFGSGAFGYSIVDMALASGLGSVTASYTLSTGVAEKLTATKHCNGTDTWVLIHKMGNDAFEAFLAGPAGVSTSPVISNIGSAYTNTFSYSGAAKFSTFGNKLATSFFYETTTDIISSIELYDFNVSTGVLSNWITLDTYTGSCVYVEFSPDASKLYTSYRAPYLSGLPTLKVLQWDLCAGSSIAASQSTVITYSSTSGRELQCGIDGKIYFDCPVTSTVPVLGCIHSPNLAGSACNASLNVLYLAPGFAGGGSLPNFVTNVMRQKPVFTNSINCGSVSFSPNQICAGAGYTATSYKWFFGDPSSGSANTSTLSNPSHTYLNNGTYSVSLIAYYPCSSDTSVQTITVAALPNLTVTGKSTICNKEKSTFTVTGASNYTWSTGSQSSTLAVNPATTTVYTVTAVNNASCQSSKIVTLTVNACVGVYEESGDLDGLHIYPNPSNGNYYVEAALNTRLIIYNQFGLKLKEVIILSNPQQLDLTEFPSGIYLLESQDNIKQRKMVMKVH